jgi:hypothetical protein
MRKITYILALALVAGFWGACHTPYSKPSDPTEAGKDFLNATLKADYSIVDGYIPNDGRNQRLYERYRETYTRLPAADKEGYNKASLVIYSVTRPTDSTALIEFSNTYKNIRDTILMIRMRGEWWADFARTFADSATVK